MEGRMNTKELNRTAVSLLGNKEIVTLYTPIGAKFELITSVNSQGVLVSTAHKYKGEYKERKYLGDIIKISRGLNAQDIECQHNKSYELLKAYAKHN